MPEQVGKDKLKKLCRTCYQYLPRTEEYFYTCNKFGFRTPCKKCIKNKTKHVVRDDSRICTCCLKDLPLSHDYFYHNKDNKQGFSTICIECYKTKPYVIDYKLKTKCNLQSTLKKRLNSLKYRSNIKKEVTDITLDYLNELWLQQNGKCAISGIEMTYCVGARNLNYNNLSVDRIDSTKGYIKGNIQFVCEILNKMKNNMEMSLFIKYCESVIEHNKVYNYE